MEFIVMEPTVSEALWDYMERGSSCEDFQQNSSIKASTLWLLQMAVLYDACFHIYALDYIPSPVM